ncbi:MAG: hypothetical protein NTY09_07285 [bacterium]|nr:hypothetical protein [bacterium]
MKVQNTILTILALLFILSLTACTADSGNKPSDTQNSGVTSNENETPLEVDETDGHGSDTSSLAPGSDETEAPPSDETIVTSDNVGGATSTTAGNLPQGWPAEVPIMDGFTILQVTYDESVNGNPGEIVVNAQGNATFDEIISFYQNIPGWTSTGGNAMSAKDEKGFFVSIVKGNQLLMINGKIEEALGQTGVDFKYIPNSQPE